MTADVALYGHWICPFATRVEFALHQRGTDLHHFETLHGTEAQTTSDKLNDGLRRDFDRFKATLKAACENANRPA